ncbi:MAG: four helix bundle protein [Paludibacteraceae bacterium]|nr:four helix bundle protein [Paludibacteraceae bacterium]
MRDFRKYRVWQEAVVLANKIYSITDCFPKQEMYSLSNQIQRAAVSVASNIAEGASRTSPVEFAHFMEIAIGSAFEVETQLVISLERNYISQEQYSEIISMLQNEEKLLNTFIQRLKEKGQ